MTQLFLSPHGRLLKYATLGRGIDALAPSVFNALQLFVNAVAYKICQQQPTAFYKYT
jgi:hypothetical protein